MTLERVVNQAFFEQPVLTVAPVLLGKVLCRQLNPELIIKQLIVEVEAYDGIEDKACHASKGFTKRTAVMFEPGGCWYVYLCYGIHWMLNIVTGAKDYPSAVLLRGVESYIGPGKLTKGLNIDKTFNGLPAIPETGLWIEDTGIVPKQIQRTPRIGVDYAGPVWSAKPYRFITSDAPQDRSRKGLIS